MYHYEEVKQEPRHLVKIAHALDFAKVSDIGIEFGDKLDHALDTLDAEINNSTEVGYVDCHQCRTA